MVRPEVVASEVDSECTDSDCSTYVESTPFTGDDTYQSPNKKEDWDQFQETQHRPESSNKRKTKTVQKFFRFLAIIITFILILFSGGFAKALMVLMTSQIKPQEHSYCVNSGSSRKPSTVTQSKEERVAWMWGLLFIFIFPEILTLIRSVRKCLFKSCRRPRIIDLFIVLFFESAHTFGVALLVYVVLPDMTAIEALMLTNCVCLVPAVFAMIYRWAGKKKTKAAKQRRRKIFSKSLKFILDIVAVVCQVSGMIAWPILNQHRSFSWYLPVAIVLTSCGWWENYVKEYPDFGFLRRRRRRRNGQMVSNLSNSNEKNEKNQEERSIFGKIMESLKFQHGILTEIGKVKYRVGKCRYLIYLLISLWKMALFLACFLIFVPLITEPSIEEEDMRITNATELFQYFKPGFAVHELESTEDHKIESVNLVPLYVILVQCGCGWVCYFLAKFSAKVQIQMMSFAIPISLIVPLVVAFLAGSCNTRNQDICAYDPLLPDYLYWKCPEENFWGEFFGKNAGFLWIPWLLSQIWITYHIWFPHCEKLAPTERIFVTPMYSSILLDQSVTMNRRRNEKQFAEVERMRRASTRTTSSVQSEGGDGTVTKIYACATMWHEEEGEMLQLLKSLCRMDKHQCTFRLAKKFLNAVNDEYFNYEAHIFFDDAFELNDNVREHVLNHYVKTFLETINKAVIQSYPKKVAKIKAPLCFPTPYGGRFEYTLPGKTKLNIHLKDKDKIRHKKRWSQVMYMYYLLGYCIMDQPGSNEKKMAKSENTYILALDGDIDFQPDAVLYLVNLMKRDKTLGAACGRVHPVGSGPMYWYQMFEYAIGHWLQKATEHVIGCVLCSPGCFSLFRAKALMSDSVLKTYTTKSKEPLHYVQYDQGEDRWLCTLILKQGYRIEYAAASDSYTNAPTSFYVFFNQRRRWISSTIANIIDLLMAHKDTVRINDDISYPYILYQGLMLIATIFGPGTIFLMLIGAINVVFRLSMYYSLLVNILPVIFFIIVCLCCKSKTQLLVAQLLSVAYAFVMMAVIVGICIEMTEDGLGTPTSIMFLAILGSFIITGLLHPMEIYCLFPFILYFLLTPSMYMLLILYSLFNMNDVSWGTREGGQKQTKQELQQAIKDQEKERKEKSRRIKLFGSKEKQQPFFDFVCCGFRFFCGSKTDLEEEQAEETIELLPDPEEGGTESDNQLGARERRESFYSLPSTSTGIYSAYEVEAKESRRPRDDMVNPYWLEDKSLKKGMVDFLNAKEIYFWERLIKKYLEPIIENKKEKEKVKLGLKKLRDKCAFGFVIVNGLFVMIVFLLQINHETIYILWPFGSSEKEDSNHIEPIGLTLVCFFGLILIIQVTAMLIHRWSTFSGITAQTRVTLCGEKGDLEEEQDEEIGSTGMIKLMSTIQNMESDTEQDSSSIESNTMRRRTVHAFRRDYRPVTVSNTNMDELVRRRIVGRMEQESGNLYNGGSSSDDGVITLNRRNTVKIKTWKEAKRRIRARINRRRSSSEANASTHEDNATRSEDNMSSHEDETTRREDIYGCGSREGTSSRQRSVSQNQHFSSGARNPTFVDSYTETSDSE